jgi:hypothetical protein
MGSANFAEHFKIIYNKTLACKRTLGSIHESRKRRHLRAHQWGVGPTARLMREESFTGFLTGVPFGCWPPVRIPSPAVAPHDLRSRGEKFTR